MDKNLSVGPMRTSYYYINFMIDAGMIKTLIIMNPSKDRPASELLQKFDRANIIEVSIPSRLPVPLWILHPLIIFNLIKSSLFSPFPILILWYPPFLLLQFSSILKKTRFLMMDSQVTLIRSTSKLTNFNRLKIFIYKIFEKRIVNYSQKAAFVSTADQLLYPRATHVNLPIGKPTNTKPQPRFQKELIKILIPRPNMENLIVFQEMYDESSEVVILLNEDLPFELKSNWSHIRFIDNYDRLFIESDAVVLLDKGGAGVANRFVTASKYHCLIFSTFDGQRGIDGEWPNVIYKGNSIRHLATNLSLYAKNKVGKHLIFEDAKVMDKISENLSSFYYPQSVRKFFF